MFIEDSLRRHKKNQRSYFISLLLLDNTNVGIILCKDQIENLQITDNNESLACSTVSYCRIPFYIVLRVQVLTIE